jgi:hypothetical protein
MTGTGSDRATPLVTMSCFVAVVVAACTPAAPAVKGGAEASAEAVAPVLSTSVTDANRGAVSRWTGTYRSAAGAIHVPDGGEWSGFKWRGDDAGDGVGDGTMTLTVDGTTQRVEGTAAGAIGEVLLTGAAQGGQVTASVRRKDPADRGLTGTLVATQTADKVDGTMRLSFGDAHILREASFTLAKAPAP